MKILVTGASGFIGSYVVRSLLENNHQVIATDLNLDKLSEVINTNNYIPITFDINDLQGKELDLYDKFKKPDAMIHLAWEGLPNYKNPIHLNHVLFSQINFIDNLVKNGLKNILIVGTCLEYGIINGCLSEETIPNPITFYAVAKDTLRRYVELIRNDYNFQFKWVRLFYLHGEGQNPNSLIPQLKKAIREEQEIFDMSGGEQLRDYLHVKDVADYLIKICLQNRITGIINCCSGNPISVRKIVENIIFEQDSKIKLNLGAYPYPDYEPFAFWGDNSKLKKILDNNA